MKQLQTDFRSDDNVRFVSITVDPKADTPKRLRQYELDYGVDSRIWKFLTGDWEKIKKIMVEDFKIAVPDAPVFHTDKLVLVDQQLQIRGYYSANSSQALQKLRKHMNELLNPSSTVGLGHNGT